MSRNGNASTGAELESLEKVRDLLLATDRRNTEDRLSLWASSSASSRKLREEVRVSEEKSLARLRTELETLQAEGVSRQQLAGLLSRLAEQIGSDA